MRSTDGREPKVRDGKTEGCGMRIEFIPLNQCGLFLVNAFVRFSISMPEGRKYILKEDDSK